ncbi:MAG: hypothetical protein ACKERG_01880 [Candidatus Hodgkinia cicadicola]
MLRSLDFKTVQVRELKSDPLKLSRASGLLVALAAATGVSLRSLAFNVASVSSTVAERIRSPSFSAIERKLHNHRALAILMPLGRCKLVALRYHFLTTHRRLTNLLPPQLLSFWVCGFSSSSGFWELFIRAHLWINSAAAAGDFSALECCNSLSICLWYNGFVLSFFKLTGYAHSLSLVCFAHRTIIKLRLKLRALAVSQG